MTVTRHACIFKPYQANTNTHRERGKIMNNELMSALEYILEDCEGEHQSALEALEDGEYLESLGLTQEQVEELHEYIDTKMKKIYSLDVAESEVDYENGFYWVKFEDGTFLQACLSNTGLPTLDLHDDGMEWGVCLDENIAAFKKYGIGQCKMCFYSAAKKDGVLVRQ